MLLDDAAALRTMRCAMTTASPACVLLSCCAKRNTLRSACCAC